MRRISSFDVYDTLLTRVHAIPDDVHLQLAEWLAQCGLVADEPAFVAARREAERRAWGRAGLRRSIRIDDIYTALAGLAGWSPDQAARAMALEVELEADAVRPLPRALQHLRNERRAGARICYVSDMHLREPHLRAMLARAGIHEPGERVFVSSEFAATKRSGGRLFEHVLRELGAGRRCVTHTGDDRRADAWMAALRGLRFRHRPQARLNHHEERVLGALAPTAGWRVRSVVSASRLARSRSVDAPVDEATWELLCSTIAPFVTGYALWVIGQAQARGLKTLHFLARDMQIVGEVARVLAAGAGLDVNCNYLHASRAAWQAPGFAGDPDYDVFWLTDQLAGQAPTAALQRLIAAPTVERLQRDGHLAARAGESPADALRRWLATPDVAAAVEAEVCATRARLMRYLDSHGFAAGADAAIVDAGWRGTLQKCLWRALVAHAPETPPRLLGLYIGLRHRVTAEQGCEMAPFLPDDVVARSGYALVSLVEGFLSADHGTTLGYEQVDGACRPVLGPTPDTVLLRQWQAVRASCLAHAHALVELPAFHVEDPALPRALAEPLVALCERPNSADAATLSRWFIDVGRNEPVLKSISRALGWRDIAKLALARWRRTPEGDVYLEGPWTRGSIAVSAAPLRGLAEWLLPRRAVRPDLE